DQAAEDLVPLRWLGGGGTGDVAESRAHDVGEHCGRNGGPVRAGVGDRTTDGVDLLVRVPGPAFVVGTRRRPQAQCGVGPAESGAGRGLLVAVEGRGWVQGE